MSAYTRTVFVPLFKVFSDPIPVDLLELGFAFYAFQFPALQKPAGYSSEPFTPHIRLCEGIWNTSQFQYSQCPFCQSVHNIHLLAICCMLYYTRAKVINMTIGERFRQLRIRKGLPALVLARRAGVSQQTVWLLERWNIPPNSVRSRQALARELGVSYEALWGDLEAQQSEGVSDA